MYNSPADYLKATPHPHPIASIPFCGRALPKFPLRPPSQAFYFSVVIENIRADYYFSAKLINCFVHGAVPIYWGAPSIADYFNISGVIVFETVQQVRARGACVSAVFFQRNCCSWTTLWIV